MGKSSQFEETNGNADRFAFLGLIAAVSACLLIAGWGPSDPSAHKMWSLTGLVGLLSALGLSEGARIQNNRKMAMLQSQATTDPLTGVGNRRLLDYELDRRIAQVKRQGTHLSILLIDVDYFKRINDHYGHHVGDKMLLHIVQSLIEHLREMDIVARYGGEEFAAILPGTNLDEALLAAERVRSAIEASRLAMSGNSLQTTVSIGVAQATADDTPKSLLERTDAALYAAKQSGRNRIHSHLEICTVPVNA